MSLRNLPEAKVFPPAKNFQWDAPSDVLDKWAGGPVAAADDDPDTISILDVIGEDWWTGEGVTAKRIDAALRKIGNHDVVVKINSPGGDMFEGIAIYNLLRGHKAKVTVEIAGLAASAASIIAMAGDEIRMGLGSFAMIHKPWGGVVGEDVDFLAAYELFKTFTSALVDIYEARTGAKRSVIEELVAAGTWMSPADAVKHGFADAIDADIRSEEVENSAGERISARRRLDALLAKDNVPRSERRRLFAEVAGGTHNAALTVTHDADLDPAALQRLIATMRS